MAEQHRTHEVIRQCGGIVHSDGNIFFTNRYQFEHAASILLGTATVKVEPPMTKPNLGCAFNCEWPTKCCALGTLPEAPTGKPGAVSLAGGWGELREGKDYERTPLQHPSTRPSSVEGGFWCDKVPYGEQRCHKQCALCAEADEATGETK